jgi:hypothetical protein
MIRKYRAALGYAIIFSALPEASRHQLKLAESDGSRRVTNSEPVLGPLLQAGPRVRILLPPAASLRTLGPSAGHSSPPNDRSVQQGGWRALCCWLRDRDTSSPTLLACSAAARDIWHASPMHGGSIARGKFQRMPCIPISGRMFGHCITAENMTLRFSKQ